MEELEWHLIHPEGERSLWVLASNQEMASYRELSPHACAHPETEFREFVDKSGRPHKKKQCMTCGSPVGTPEKRQSDEKLPPWDDALRDQWFGECDEQRLAIEGRLIERTASLETSGYASYEEYLATPNWAEKRGLVMSRDNGTCQACLKEAATEVHHLTYDRIFSEPLFDLVAICRGCHEQLHKKKIVAIEAARAKGLT